MNYPYRVKFKSNEIEDIDITTEEYQALLEQMADKPSFVFIRQNLYNTFHIVKVFKK